MWFVLVDIIILLSLMQMIFFALHTGFMRNKTGVHAPATTGDPRFERIYRVQMNSMEMVILFIPAILLAKLYSSPMIAVFLGSLYLVGRLVYWRGYIQHPKQRIWGFLMTLFAVFILILMALWGAISSL